MHGRKAAMPNRRERWDWFLVMVVKVGCRIAGVSGWRRTKDDSADVNRNGWKVGEYPSRGYWEVSAVSGGTGPPVHG
jgi:hypothetical protein